MKRRRRRDILRVQLVRIFELLADAGVISQMYIFHNKFGHFDDNKFALLYIWFILILYHNLFFVVYFSFLQSQWRVGWREPLSEQYTA